MSDIQHINELMWDFEILVVECCENIKSFDIDMRLKGLKNGFMDGLRDLIDEMEVNE